MASGLSHDPECWRCPHPAHLLGCDWCDCTTSVVGAVNNHRYDDVAEK